MARRVAVADRSSRRFIVRVLEKGTSSRTGCRAGSRIRNRFAHWLADSVSESMKILTVTRRDLHDAGLAAPAPSHQAAAVLPHHVNVGFLLANTALLYFDDFALGQRFSHPARPVMDLVRVKQFAAEFDPQPFHMDEEAAASHPVFAGITASGWHTAATTARLLVESVPLAGGLIGLGVEISWPRPTRAGDQLSIITEVMEVTPSRSKPDRGVITLRTETRNQRDEVVQVLITKAMVPRRPTV